MIDSSNNITVGEKKDIELLQDIFELSKNQKTKKVLIVGGAGVGKSTLM